VPASDGDWQDLLCPGRPVEHCGRRIGPAGRAIVPKQA
jgi:hypothetical protein